MNFLDIFLIETTETAIGYQQRWNSSISMCDGLPAYNLIFQTQVYVTNSCQVSSIYKIFIQKYHFLAEWKDFLNSTLVLALKCD